MRKASIAFFISTVTADLSGILAHNQNLRSSNSAPPSGETGFLVPRGGRSAAKSCRGGGAAGIRQQHFQHSAPSASRR